MTEGPAPVALAYEPPDLGRSRDDREVLWVARACTLGAIASLLLSFAYLIKLATRQALVDMPPWLLLMYGTLFVLMPLCIWSRPVQNESGRSRWRAMRWWWIAAIVMLLSSLFGMFRALHWYRIEYGDAVATTLLLQSVVGIPRGLLFLLIVPLLFDRPAAIFLRRVTLLTLVLIIAATLGIGIELLRRWLLWRSQSGSARATSSLEFGSMADVQLWGPALAYVVAAILLIVGTRKPIRGRLIRGAVILFAVGWLATLAPHWESPYRWWTELRQDPFLACLTAVESASEGLSLVAAPYLLLRFTLRNDARRSHDLDHPDAKATLDRAPPLADIA